MTKPQYAGAGSEFSACFLHANEEKRSVRPKTHTGKSLITCSEDNFMKTLHQVANNDNSCFKSNFAGVFFLHYIDNMKTKNLKKNPY